MKTHNQNLRKQPLEKVLIYDDDCPLCQAYSGAFVKMKLLKPENRLSFKHIPDESYQGKMDPVRSKNEIPLIDRQGGETLYGTDALIEILASQWPLFRYFKQNNVLNFLSKKAYAFISYNRKIIVPAKKDQNGIDCSPSVHIGWRLSFILLAFTAGSLMINHNLNKDHSWEIYASTFLIPCISALFISRSKWLEYVGNLAMVWLLQGAFLYLISFLHLGKAVYVIIPGLFALVFFEHFRRVRILDYAFPIHIVWLLSQMMLWWWLYE